MMQQVEAIWQLKCTRRLTWHISCDVTYVSGCVCMAWINIYFSQQLSCRCVFFDLRFCNAADQHIACLGDRQTDLVNSWPVTRSTSSLWIVDSPIRYNRSWQMNFGHSIGTDLCVLYMTYPGELLKSMVVWSIIGYFGVWADEQPILIWNHIIWIEQTRYPKRFQTCMRISPKNKNRLWIILWYNEEFVSHDRDALCDEAKFQIFHQWRNAFTRNRTGTGFGWEFCNNLVIGQNIVEL